MTTMKKTPLPIVVFTLDSSGHNLIRHVSYADPLAVACDAPSATIFFRFEDDPEKVCDCPIPKGTYYIDGTIHTYKELELTFGRIEIEAWKQLVDDAKFSLTKKMVLARDGNWHVLLLEDAVITNGVLTR